MNVERLKETATVLKMVLLNYSDKDNIVADLKQQLDPLINEALVGQTEGFFPRSAIPGGRTMLESHLREYRDLQEAYANFSIVAKLGDLPDPDTLRRRIEHS